MVVTAVIPVHNHEKWVNDAVLSVAAQEYRELRIVVVDDGSTDSSSETVRDFIEGRGHKVAEADDLTQWLGKVKRYDTPIILMKFARAHGPAFARNAGIHAGWDKTDVFAFLDSDDLYFPGKIQKSVKLFQDQNIGVVYSDFETFNESGLELRQYKEPFSRQRLLQECIVNCDSLVSKKAIEKVGLMDEALRVCEDYDWWLRISESFMIYHLPECLVRIRVGSHSSTSNVHQEQWKACYARVFEKLQKRQEYHRHHPGG